MGVNEWSTHRLTISTSRSTRTEICIIDLDKLNLAMVVLILGSSQFLLQPRKIQLTYFTLFSQISLHYAVVGVCQPDCLPIDRVVDQDVIFALDLQVLSGKRSSTKN